MLLNGNIVEIEKPDEVCLLTDEVCSLKHSKSA